MKRRHRMSPSQRRANARRAAALAAARRVETLKRDLLREDLDVRGDPPVLSDGKGTPHETLALQFPRLAERLRELVCED